jgi:hypothetical protein
MNREFWKEDALWLKQERYFSAHPAVMKPINGRGNVRGVVHGTPWKNISRNHQSLEKQEPPLWE